MHNQVSSVALVMLLLLSSAAFVSAATILDFQCPETEVAVAPTDNGGDLRFSAATTNRTYVLAAGAYTITGEISLTQNNTCYVAAAGASANVTARFDDGYAWVLRQNATLGMQGFTLKGEGRFDQLFEGAGGVYLEGANRLVVSNVRFVGLARDNLAGAVWNNGGTLDATNVTFDSCFSRGNFGGGLWVINGGQATLTQASFWPSHVCLHIYSLHWTTATYSKLFLVDPRMHMHVGLIIISDSID